MPKFKLSDKHIAFINAVASGMDQYKAYQQHIAVNKKASKQSYQVASSLLMKRVEVQDLVAKAKQERQLAIIKEAAENVAEEFKGYVLSTDQLDAYHSAIIQGKVEIEEVVPVVTITRATDENGRVKEVSRTTSFVRVKRAPNVREKQTSIDALYKRRGAYAPMKGLFGFGKVTEEEEGDDTDRFIVLSDGTKLPF